MPGAACAGAGSGSGSGSGRREAAGRTAQCPPGGGALPGAPAGAGARSGGRARPVGGNRALRAPPGHTDPAPTAARGVAARPPDSLSPRQAGCPVGIGAGWGRAHFAKRGACVCNPIGRRGVVQGPARAGDQPSEGSALWGPTEWGVGRPTSAQPGDPRPGGRGGGHC